MKCYQQENGLVIVQDDNGKDLMAYPPSTIESYIASPRSMLENLMDDTSYETGLTPNDELLDQYAASMFACIWYSERHSGAVSSTMHSGWQG